MPAGVCESIVDNDNVDGMIDKSVEKLKNVLDQLRCYIVEEDLYIYKELQDIILLQGRIKERVKSALDQNSQNTSELERIDQEDLTSTPWQYLGHGSFGNVFKAKMKGSSVAVKILQAKQNPSKLNEGRILRLLRHDNIVAYRGMDLLKKDLPSYGVKQDSFMIIMEYVPDNLSMHVESLKSPEVKGLPKSQVWDFGEQIMSGLYYLHSFSIAHRDLKPDNILLEKGVARMKLKLADFGLALHLKNPDKSGEDEQQHQRWCAPECFGPEMTDEVESFMKSDIFSYGLILHYMITGDKPWAAEESHAAGVERMNYALPDLPENLGKGPLNDLYHSCLRQEPEQRPSAGEIIKKRFQAYMTNPYTETTQTAEFFTCGFLKDTQIVVADSLVDESLVDSCGSKRPQGYPPDCLECEVEIDNEEHNDCPFNSEYREWYLQYYQDWRNKALDNIIDDNPNIALKGLTTPREGAEEEQRVVLKFAQATYVHHRAMRDVWKKKLDEDTKTHILSCKTSVDPMFSTSFGLHVAVITADQKFLFTRRAKRGGMASPGTLTCGAVESCSVKDYIKRGDKTYVKLVETAARGLDEELGIRLKGKDYDAICLTTVYLKYDNHEWGMCGFVDLSDERIAKERRLTLDSINSRFTGGICKDKFEHDCFEPVPFKLHEMAHFVRENFHNFASSAKLVVVKVMQSFFGVSEVEKIFKALDSSN